MSPSKTVVVMFELLTGEKGSMSCKTGFNVSNLRCGGSGDVMKNDERLVTNFDTKLFNVKSCQWNLPAYLKADGKYHAFILSKARIISLYNYMTFT